MFNLNGWLAPMQPVGLKNVSKATRDEFKATFGVDLATFWDFTGFDIIALDLWLEVPDGTSTADFIRAKYGQNAVDFVRNLIGPVSKPE